MKIIHRYIFIELIKIFFISVVFLTTVFLLEQMLYMAEMLANRGLTFTEGLKLMVFTCPVFLVLSMPLSVLIAPVIIFNQICGDNEYAAMRTSGWSFLYLMRPVILFSILIYIATNCVVFYAIPWGTNSFKETIFDIVQKRAHINIKPRMFNKEFQNLVLYANDKKGKSKLIDVFVADNSDKGNSKMILAKEGIIVTDPETYKIKLQFQDGTVHELTKDGKSYNILDFDRYERYLEIPSMERLKSQLTERHRNVSYSDLKEKIRQRQAEGHLALKARTRLGKSFSIPFSCLLFGLTGAALGIKSSRSGRSGGFIVSVIVAALYYIALVFSQSMGALGMVHPTFSVWIPNIGLFFFTFYIVWKVVKESPMTFFIRLADACTEKYELTRNRASQFYNGWVAKRRSRDPASRLLQNPRKKGTPKPKKPISIDGLQ